MQEIKLFLLDSGLEAQPWLCHSSVGGSGPSSACVHPPGPPGSIRVKSMGLPGSKPRLCVVHSHTLPGHCLSLAVFCSYLVIVTVPGALSAALLSRNPPDPDALAKKITLEEGRCPTFWFFSKYSHRYWKSGNEEVILFVHLLLQNVQESILC